MSKSFTYNVVLTKSHKVAKKLFFQESITGAQVNRRRLKSIYSDLNSEERADTLVVSPFNDDGFISLINEFPASSKRFITIRMLETSRVLENFLISTNAQEELVISRFKKRIRNLSKLDDETLDILRKIRPRFYLAYGLGDDVSEWAGPFVIDLIDVNLRINSDGVRELEMLFTPALDSLKVFSNIQFIDEDLSQGRSVFDTTKATTTTIEADSSLTFKLEGLPGSKSPGSTPEFGGKRLAPLNDDGDKFNFAVRRLIRRYLSKKYTTIPEQNILVLFAQDLDKGEAFESFSIFPQANFMNRYQEILGEYGMYASYPFKEIIEEEQEDLDTEINKRIKIASDEALKETKEVLKKNDPRIKQIDNQILKLGADRKKIEQGIISGAISPGSNLGASQFLDEEVNKIDTELDQLIKRKNQILEAIDIVAKKQVSEQNFFNEELTKRISQKASPANHDARMNAAKLGSPFDGSKVNMGFYVEYVIDNIDNNILEPLRPFYKFFRKLKTKTQKAFDPIIFEENDIKVSTLLKKHGLIADETAPVIVIGERSLVRQLLYSKLIMPDLGSALSYSKSPKSLKSRWEAYRKEATRVYHPRKVRTSSFNEAVDFGPYKGFESLVTGESLIFMHNLKNSNVTDISFDNSPYKAELLSIANESIYALLDQGLKGNQDILDNSLKIDIIDYLSEKAKMAGTDSPVAILEFIKKDRESIKYLKQRGESTLRANGKDVLDLILFRLKGKRFADLKIKNRPGENMKYDADILRKVNSYVARATVKTLPFFNSIDYLNRDCLLVGAPNRIVGSKIDRERDKLPEPAVFSNNYNILSYKHVINSSEAYSEFELYNPEIGVPGSDMNINFATLLGIAEDDIQLKVDLDAQKPGKVKVNVTDTLKGETPGPKEIGPPLDEYDDPYFEGIEGGYFDYEGSFAREAFKRDN